MCRSDPHTPARVSFTRMAPGSTSGTGYSRSSNSPPSAFRTATRPGMWSLLEWIQRESGRGRAGCQPVPRVLPWCGFAHCRHVRRHIRWRWPMRRGLLTLLCLPSPASADVAVQAYALPPGGGPHDVAVGTDGIVWYTAQRGGQLGRLDPATGKVDLISLGPTAAPHGVIIGPDGAPWVT